MKRPAAIAVAVLIILQVVTLFRMDALQSELQNMRNHLASLSSQQSGQISALQSKIDALQKSQASIIDSHDYKLGAVNPDTLTVPVTFTVSPKEMKTDTQASLQVSGKSTAMTRNGAAFTATITADLFTPLQATVMLIDGNVQRTERLDVRANLRDQLLPFVHMTFENGGESGYSRKSGDKSGELRKIGRLRVEAKPVVGNTLKAARLVIDIDGKTISEKPVSTGIGMATDLNERIPLAAGQKLTMTIIATDELGLTYQSVVDQFGLDAQGNPASTVIAINQDAIIIDKSGKAHLPQY